MNLSGRIRDQFGEHAQAVSRASEELVEPIAQAVERMVTALSEDHKIIACANAPADAECERLVSVLVGRFERERVALPAIALQAKYAQDHPPSAESPMPGFARQIEGLGRPGDVLLAVSPFGQCANVIAAIHAAHERGMSVVALTGRTIGGVGAALRAHDIQIALPADRLVVIEALQRIALNCLCDAIDWNFLGDEA